MLGAALELSQQADTEQQTARASTDTADDVSTPRVDERSEALNDARTHIGRIGAREAKSTGLIGQADTNQATAARGAPVTVTAALSYPTPITQVTAAQASARAAPAARRPPPAARQATRKAPTLGRRR